MKFVPVQSIKLAMTRQMVDRGKQNRRRFIPRLRFSKNMVLLVCSAVLLFSSFVVSQNLRNAHAANPGPGNGCSWYTVHRGDTLSLIAHRYNTNYSTLARVNGIRNVNLIFVNQQLCIPYRLGNGGNQGGGRGSSGVLANGTVLWYDYNALQWSSRDQVVTLLRRAASMYGLPANLLLAIAWQESGWYQHVIAWDGGIGVMQLMPYTAMGLNRQTGIRRDPYHLWDNILLGTIYLRSLWNGFHGDLVNIISAYNEGGWAVIHRGIFNWRYVNNVLSLMRTFRNR
ncbi:MAG TPA: transglycosylase SLT domain-containing protein [Ktedonobacteraceae bacterium]|nr:transglycosylase SLT domain-containing protein [Ktedonobacteraceae bacterium]